MNPSKHQDTHFSSFAMGATIGVIAALLFGTEEGRKIVKKILDAIPDKYKKIPDALTPHDEPTAPRTPIITPQETPHHTTFAPENTLVEAPPPPPPVIRPHHPL